jgi:hypothetical protein
MSEWVKCSERMPEYDKWCIVVISVPKFTTLAKLEKSKHDYWSGQYENFDLNEITHWQYSPNLPKD